MTCPWGRTEHRKNRRGKKVLAFCESTHHYYQQFMVKRRSLSFESRDKCTAHHYAQGGIPQWGPNSELHTDLQLTMDMPEHYTYRSATILDWRCDTNIDTRHYCPCTSTVTQGNPNWGLARADTAGGTLLPWEGSFYASSRRPRFEAWRLAGSSSGALIRAPMMLAAEGRRLCKSRRESFLSSPCLNR